MRRDDRFVRAGRGHRATALDRAVTLTLEGTASEALITVSGPDGGIVGDVTLADGMAIWRAEGDLPEETTLSWEAVVCDDTASGTFTTGTLERAVAPEDLADDTFAVDLANATWISPEGGEDVVKDFFGGAFLIGVQAVSELELDTLGASGQATTSGSWQQDPCYATIDFDPVDFTNNPYFVLEAEEMRFTVQGTEAIIYDAEITGGLTDDEIVDGTFEGEIDMRDYRAQFGSDPCAALESFLGIECTICTSDGEEQCLFLQAVDVEGEEVAGLQLVPNETPEECDTGGEP